MINHKLVLTLALMVTPIAHSLTAVTLPYRLDCDSGKGNKQTMRVHEFTVLLSPRDGGCHLEVSGTVSGPLFERTATGMQVSSALDLAHDGRPFLLIQADTSPYTMWLLSLGPHPGVVASVKNGYGFWVQNGCADGRWHIWTEDGAFKGEPELVDVYHYDLLVPLVVLDVQGDKLFDATSLCKPYFERRIAAIRAGLTSLDIAAFKNGNINDAFRSRELKGKILGIAFADLYNGNNAAARGVLREMWPDKDQERVWRWMLQKRSKGVLAHLSDKAK
jgi:hypothetical protein